MASVVACRECGMKNPTGSKFCNHCGSALPPSTSLLCPNCQTPNPSDLLYCDTCGTRLLQEQRPVEEPERPSTPVSGPQAFSLPSRPAGETADLNVESGIPDWLKTGDTPDVIHTDEAETEIPEWLREIEVDEKDPSLDDVSADHDPEDDLPDWLTSGAEPQQLFAARDKSTDELFENLSEGSQDSELSGEKWAQEDLPDWLADLAKPGTGPLPVLPVDDASSGENALPDWLDEIETDESDAPESIPDWLTDLEVDESDEFADESDFEPVESGLDEPTPVELPSVAELDSEVPDWLTDLEAQTTVEEPQEEELELPDWLEETEQALEGSSMTPAGENVPDWLANLEEDSPIVVDEGTDTIGEPANAGVFDSDAPEWLAELDDSPPAGDSPTDEQATPDWLDELDTPAEQNDLGGLSEEDVALLLDESDAQWLAEQEQAEQNKPSALIEEDEPLMPDWLSELEPASSDEPSQADKPNWLGKSTPNTSIITGESLPDWLGDMEIADEEPLPTGEALPNWLDDVEPPAPDAPETDLPDWLNELDNETESADVATPDIAPDWLGELATSEADTEAGLKDAPAPDVISDEEPDWLTSTDSTPTEPSDEAVFDPDFMPDWLNQLAESDLTDEPAEPSDDALPDWLAEAPADESLSELDESESMVEADSDIAVGSDLPDWLQELAPGDEDVTDVDSDDLAEMFPAGADLPDWLADDIATSTSGDDELPDWLSDVDEVDEGDLSVSVETTSDTPDWLEDFAKAGTSPDYEEEPVTDTSDDGAIISSPTTEDLPDWLDDVLPQVDAFDEFDFLDIEEEEPAPLTSDDLSGVPKQLVGDSLPSWLEDNPLEYEQPAEQNTLDEIPDWLKPASDAAFASTLFDEDDGDSSTLEDSGEWADLLGGLPSGDDDEIIQLSEGEIPEWLEALKPRELMEEGDPEPVRPLMTTGPLTGLRGVIEIEPVIARPDGKERPLPEYNITKAQQQQVTLLKQLTHEDRKPAVVIAKAGATPMLAPIRLLLAILLIGAIVAGWFFVSLFELDPVPVRGITQTQETIAQLSGAPALVVFDYPPAMAGELNPVAELLLAELEAKGMPIVVASQSPAGLAIGQQLTEDYTNATHLGFIPGEANGLRQLSACLQIQCDTLFSRPLASEAGSALIAVDSVIVLTSEREDLVNWLEQVERTHDGKFVMGVTQALSPVAVTYLNSGQLEGLLTGLPAVAAYESAEPSDSTSEHLSASAFGQWMTVALLILGNLYYLIRARRS